MPRIKKDKIKAKIPSEVSGSDLEAQFGVTVAKIPNRLSANSLWSKPGCGLQIWTMINQITTILIFRGDGPSRYSKCHF